MKKFIIIFLFYFDPLNCIQNDIDQLSIYKQQLEFCDQLKDPQAVAACKNNILLLMAQNQQWNPQNQQRSKKNRRNRKKNNQNFDKTPEILMHFANVANNLGKITGDSHNPANISQNLFNIFAEIIIIAATMTR